MDREQLQKAYEERFGSQGIKLFSMTDAQMIEALAVAKYDGYDVKELANQVNAQCQQMMNKILTASDSIGDLGKLAGRVNELSRVQDYIDAAERSLGDAVGALSKARNEAKAVAQKTGKSTGTKARNARMDDTRYRGSHGERPKPSVYGLWVFTIGGKEYQASGKLNDAFENALRQYREKSGDDGYVVAYVMP